jgi:DNA integrity scanning protein DisA with diadenylate cyclase activity
MKQKILLNGIIAGIAVIGYVLLFYYMDRKLALSASVRFSSLLVCALFMYLTIKDVREPDFKVLLRGAFAVFLIANALYYVFDYVLFNIIDKSLMDMEKEMAIEMYRPSTPINELYDMEQGIRNAQAHNFSSNLMQFARWTILGFGVALLVSYLVKRNNK